MTEKEVFIAMLNRVGVGYGKRTDYDPPGESVQVEHENETTDGKGGWMVTDWQFDAEGKLTGVTLYEGEKG